MELAEIYDVGEKEGAECIKVCDVAGKREKVQKFVA